jgi:c-di-GMP-binding flagellar brake protein YcgR
MSLIPLDKDELEIGKPLPWTLFDPQRNCLAVAGDVIKTNEHLLLLLDSNPCRELTWESGSEGDDAEELTSEEITTAGKGDSNKQTSFPFGAMNLKVGDRLQVQPPAQLSMERFIVKLVGYLNNISLLVTAPIDTNGLRLQLIEGEKLVVRIFSSQNAFGFASTIEKICKIPFDYLHLSFPDEVQGMVIRKAPRVRTRIIAAVAIGGQTESASAIISNLSANGALLDAKRNLADKGDFIKLSFRVNLHNIDAYLTVNAAVRAIFADEAVDNGGTTLIHHGLEFVDLQPNDSVILQSMIYQQMIERPHTMA